VAGVAGFGALAGCPGSSTDDETVTPARVPTADAETPTPAQASQGPQATLTPADADGDDEFGETMAVSAGGTTVAVGAPADEDPNGEVAGSVYVFEATDGGWTQRAKLAPDDGDSFDAFGYSVAVSSDGTTVLSGAETDDNANGDSAGAAYVFEETDDMWTQRAKLTPDDGDSVDGVGCSVALSDDGTVALVGACEDEDPNGTLAGSAYVFGLADSTWSQRAKLAPDDGDSFDNAGASVALSGDGTTALVGAPGDEDPHGRLAGSAYVFEAASGLWPQRAKLTPEDGDRQDFFGQSLAVSADGATALVGAYSDEESNGDEAGSAYVFEVTDAGWSQRAKLTAEAGEDGDFLGFAVGLDSEGTVAVAGAPGSDAPDGDDAGAAYVFEAADRSWTQRAKLATEDRDSGDLFGRGVGVSGDGTTALVGAPFDSTEAGEFAGSVSVFTL